MNNLAKINEKLDAVGSILDKVKKAKETQADCGISNDDLMCSIENIKWTIAWLRDDIYSLHDRYANHTQKGHIPPILGADKMEKALKVLSMDKDYEVQKPVIYARANVIEIG
jgi:hypothetical protein